MTDTCLFLIWVSLLVIIYRLGLISDSLNEISKHFKNFKFMSFKYRKIRDFKISSIYRIDIKKVVDKGEEPKTFFAKLKWRFLNKKKNLYRIDLITDNPHGVLGKGDILQNNQIKYRVNECDKEHALLTTTIMYDIIDIVISVDKFDIANRKINLHARTEDKHSN